MNPTISVAGVLLSAGLSTRMGRHKALIPWKGSTMIEYQIRALLLSGVDCICVVLGYQNKEIAKLIHPDPKVIIVENQNYMLGKTTSIKTGINAVKKLNPEHLLLLNVDQPREPELIKSIIEFHKRTKSLITVPKFKLAGGHPVIFDSRYTDDLENISEESLGIKDIMSKHQRSVTVMNIDSSDVLLDLNTPEDYESAL